MCVCVINVGVYQLFPYQKCFNYFCKSYRNDYKKKKKDFVKLCIVSKYVNKPLVAPKDL